MKLFNRARGYVKRELARNKYRSEKEELSKRFGGEQRYAETTYDGVSNESYIDRYFKIADLLPYKEADEHEQLVVLDLGSSFGIAAFGLKELLRIKGYDTHIIGVDPERRNFTFPAQHRGRELTNGLDERVQGIAQAIPLTRESVDFVIFQNSNYGNSFSEGDSIKTLKEIVRVLKPTGSAYLLEHSFRRGKFPDEIQERLIDRDRLREYTVMQRTLNPEPAPQ